MTKEKIRQRREEIYNLIRKIGRKDICIAELAKKHRCSRQAIYRDIKALYNRILPEKQYIY